MSIWQAWEIYGSWWQAVIYLLPFVVGFVAILYPRQTLGDGSQAEPNATIQDILYWVVVVAAVVGYYGLMLKTPFMAHF